MEALLTSPGSTDAALAQVTTGFERLRKTLSAPATLKTRGRTRPAPSRHRAEVQSDRQGAELRVANLRGSGSEGAEAHADLDPNEPR